MNMSTLDEVFDRFLNGNTIFRNREVLRHDYVPEKLPHRETEIKHLGSIVAPTLKGYRCSNVFIYGKTGTGKTAVVRYVLKHLVRRAGELGAPVYTCYVNCRLAGTEYRILTNLCESIGVKVPFTGLAQGEVFKRFRNGLESKGGLLLAVLDEVDVLVKTYGDALLYELTRINGELERSKVSLVGISNDLRFKDMLDPRVLSSLSEEELVFRPYNAAELRDILEERAKLAFREGVLAEGVISLCAALAAAEHGDARRSLDLLRVAGELAEREGAQRVEERHVREAEKRIERDRIEEAVRNLPLHSKLVLCSVYLLNKRVSSAATGDIYNVYCELCNRIGVEPLTQRRVSGLISEQDMLGLLNSQVVSMGRYGRTKKTRLAIPKSTVKAIFSEDDQLEGLVAYTPKCLLNPK